MTWQHFCDIVETVKQMHGLKVIHRDLTLSNVFDVSELNLRVKVPAAFAVCAVLCSPTLRVSLLLTCSLC